MPADLTISMESKEQPVKPFIEAVSVSMEILQELDVRISQRRRGVITWLIRTLHYGSPAQIVMEAATREDSTDVGAKVIEIFIQGIEVLNNGNELPDFFSEKALQSAQRLGSLATTGRELKLLSERHVVQVSSRLSSNTAAMINRSYSAFGSVEGVMEMATLHENTYCRVYDSIQGWGVACYFHEDMLEHVREGFGKRVSVEGLLRSNRLGRPESIKMQSIKVLRPDYELPSIKQVRGVAKGMTEGLSAETYLREIRSDDKPR